MAQLEEATKAGPGKIAFFDQLRRDFWIFKVKECFENVPSSFWWNLETFGQPGEKISVILHQRVCGIFTRRAGRCGVQSRRSAGIHRRNKEFPGACDSHHTVDRDAAWALRSPEVGASEHQTSSAARALRNPEERSSSNAKPEADLLVKNVIAARRTCSVARPSQYIPFELLVTRELTRGTIGV